MYGTNSSLVGGVHKSDIVSRYDTRQTTSEYDYLLELGSRRFLGWSGQQAKAVGPTPAQLAPTMEGLRHMPERAGANRDGHRHPAAEPSAPAADQSRAKR
jgi:hypothetical protein